MVQIDHRDGVMTLTLDRPEVGNALGPELLERLAAGLTSAANDETVRVVVITGAGKHFSAGADLNAMKAMRGAGPAANLEDARRTQQLFAGIAEMPRPVVARVNGAARGGGVGLLAAADVVIAATGATFAFTEVRLGIIPAMIAPFVIARVGPARARRLFLTGETFTAADALGWGLVDHVVEADRLDEKVAEVATELGRGGPLALAEIKLLVRDLARTPAAQAGELTAERIARLRTGDEGQEGMAAFLEKRAARWLR